MNYPALKSRHTYNNLQASDVKLKLVSQFTEFRENYFII